MFGQLVKRRWSDAHFPSPLPAIEIRRHRHAVAKTYLAIDRSPASAVPDCHGSAVPLAQPFLTAQPIEFRCHAIAKIYPIDRCRVPITPIATILLPRNKRRVGPFADI
jgi:hypothetical protein